MDQTARLSDSIEFKRTWLDESSWVDIARAVLTDPTEVATALTDRIDWNDRKIFRYDHWVEVPRLGGSFRLSDPPHPALASLHSRLQYHYGVSFDAPAVALYRDGSDGVGFHRDRDLKWLDETRIALLVLGANRPFLIRPRRNRNRHELADRGAVVEVGPRNGDMIVMGGACQANWEHSVPQVRHQIGPRMSVQWRWSSRTGRQERGGSFSDPALYTRP